MKVWKIFDNSGFGITIEGDTVIDVMDQYKNHTNCDMDIKQDIEKWRKKLDFRITDSKSEYHHHHIIEEFAYKYDLTIPQATTILESTRTLVRNK